jgi:histidine triad (HIT) family protein
MADCIFCKLLAGEFPSQKVYESERIVAILDINPVSLGHTLVMPRAHHEILTDLPGELASELVKAAQVVAQGVLKATGAEGFNLLMNNRRCSGQAIDHAHFHVIPRRKEDGIKFQWKTTKYAEGEIEKQGESIRAALR